MIPAVIELYASFTLMLAIVFGITSMIQYKKYKSKKLGLHLWSSVAFLVLCAQEIISFYWLMSSVLFGYPLAYWPWHLQALVVLFALNLLGLSMTGKIYDKW